jgi:hypothetical protein
MTSQSVDLVGYSASDFVGSAENLGVHIVKKRLGVGLPVNVKLLDGLNGHPQADLPANNGGRVLVELGDSHPAGLIKLTPCGRTRALARRTPSSRHCIRDIPAWACHRYIPHEI